MVKGAASSTLEQLHSLDHWLATAEVYGLKLAGALGILLVGLWLAKRMSRALERVLTRTQTEATLRGFLRNIAYGAMVVVILLAALQFLGFAPASLLAVLGAAGLGIGLALKDSLSNVAAGVMLVTLKPFRVGDIVEVAGQSGKVEAISIFQTRLRGPDNQTFTLPNSLVTTAPIINRSPGLMRRVELVIGIDYADDIDTARSAALDVIHADDRVLADPAPDVVVYDLAESSVKLGIRCHVGNDDWFAVKCDLLEKIKKAFDANAIHIPYPQQDLHLYVRDAEGGRRNVGDALAR